MLAGAVAERAKEIGVRMAVGAARGQIVRMVLRWGLSMAASGIAIGDIVAAVRSAKALMLFKPIGINDL